MDQWTKNEMIEEAKAIVSDFDHGVAPQVIRERFKRLWIHAQAQLVTKTQRDLVETAQNFEDQPNQDKEILSAARAVRVENLIESL